MKHDHRTNPRGGRFAHYLLNGYLLRDAYHPAGARLSYRAQTQPHYTERNGEGQWVRTEHGGVPALKSEVVNHLDGFPYSVVRLAISLVRRQNPDVIAALEYYQQPAGVRPSRGVWAASQGIDQSTITRRFETACRMIERCLPYAREVYERGELVAST